MFWFFCQVSYAIDLGRTTSQRPTWISAQPARCVIDDGGSPGLAAVVFVVA
jgi:hypothetical protein